MAERGEDIKLIRLEDIPEGETITLYRHGDFVDLCRGRTSNAPARSAPFKLLEASGAYFKGDERNEMLQRIYGTAFVSARGARRLPRAPRGGAGAGTTAGWAASSTCSSFHAEAPASPFFHPTGAVVYNAAGRATCGSCTGTYGYDEVITPQIFDVELWKALGPLRPLPRQHVLRRRVETSREFASSR